MKAAYKRFVGLLFLFLGLIVASTSEKLQNTKKIKVVRAVNVKKRVENADKSREESIAMIKLFENKYPYAYNVYLRSNSAKGTFGIELPGFLRTKAPTEKENSDSAKVLKQMRSKERKKKIEKFKSRMHVKVIQAYENLKILCENGDIESERFLAEMEFFGKGGSIIDLKSAFKRYERIAQKIGDPEAQFMLAIFYTLGLGGIKRNPGLATTYLTLSAQQGYNRAELMMGFRYMEGIETMNDCEKSMHYYNRVANKAMKAYYDGPPLGKAFEDTRGYVYTRGSGLYGTNARASTKPIFKSKKEMMEIIEYYQFRLTNKDIEAYVVLADLYLKGHEFIPVDYTKSRKYLLEVSTMLFNLDTLTLKKPNEVKHVDNAKKVCGMLGSIYLNGLGVKQDLGLAKQWLNLGLELKDGFSINALGQMYLDGLGVEQSTSTAKALFKQAAFEGSTDGLVNYALSLIDGSPTLAFEYFSKAKFFSSNIRAAYYMADMYRDGIGTFKSCTSAAYGYGGVGYMGDWAGSLLKEGDKAYERGAIESALLNYLVAAEIGMKVGIADTAYLLEKQIKLLEESGDEPLLFGNLKRYKKLLAVYYTRAANMRVPDARLKQGDMYYYGIGVDRDYGKASSAYLLSAENDGDAMGMYNIGYMYEFGIGVQRDYHLAKRWYDKSLEAYGKGALAIYISLCRLAVNYYYSKWVKGENVGRLPLFGAPSIEDTRLGGANSPLVQKDGFGAGSLNRLDNKDGLNTNQNQNNKESENKNEDGNGNENENENLGGKLNISFGIDDSHLIIILCLLLGYFMVMRRRRVLQDRQLNEGDEIRLGNIPSAQQSTPASSSTSASTSSAPVTAAAAAPSPLPPSSSSPPLPSTTAFTTTPINNAKMTENKSDTSVNTDNNGILDSSEKSSDKGNSNSVQTD